jgi:telomerase reverse transcriptase
MDRENTGAPVIEGLASVYPNKYVHDMKAAPWPQILKLLGKGGDCVMIDLLLDCGIFLSVKSGRGNYYQISGTSSAMKYSFCY